MSTINAASGTLFPDARRNINLKEMLYMKGTITKWFADRAFGFIRPDDGRDDLFVHINEVADGIDSLTPGTRVSYEIGQDKRSGRTRAVNVRVVQN